MSDFIQQFIPDNLAEVIILCIGFLGQFFFAGRILIQWILSEKAKKVVSPLIFWIFSIIGSYLFFVYGWLRADFAILFGQFISYYIYLWNIKIQGSWARLPLLLQAILLGTPLAALLGLLLSGVSITKILFQNEDIGVALLVFGSLGQVVFTLRFVYQIIYSQQKKESILPLGFWWISLLGSSIIISYGVLRSDIILVLGQLAGWFVYIRNICIELNYRRKKISKA